MFAEAYIALTAMIVLLVRPALGWYEHRLGKTSPMIVRLMYLLAASTLVAIALLLLNLHPSDIGIYPPSLWATFVTAVGTSLTLLLDSVGAKLLFQHPLLLQRRVIALKKWLQSSKPNRFLVFIYIGIAAVYEEVVFRGIGIHVLEVSGTETLTGLILLSVIFGLQHTASGWLGVLYASFFGLYFGLLYLAAGSLFAPIVVHAVGNWFTVLCAYPRMVRTLERQPGFMF
ncbi:CPBP family intramembrane glutamic endopeptidase [Sinorhizobium meliloti]|uniref:CPBP family intramembrane glutamic endopeptidase n=1 Tax=Rhizobium meliloti TaxID=382 RepID=UPI00059ACD32|nr:CPBP family intramembrane glutamic endopeptidase [Sinorhizobium meliloti]